MATATNNKRMATIRNEARRVDAAVRKLKEMGIDVTKMDESTLNDRRKLSAVLRVGQAASQRGRTSSFEFWRNAVLSGIPTQIADVIGNTANGFYEYAQCFVR
jgi:hypothetical protein